MWVAFYIINAIFTNGLLKVFFNKIADHTSASACDFYDHILHSRSLDPGSLFHRLRREMERELRGFLSEDRNHAYNERRPDPDDPIGLNLKWHQWIYCQLLEQQDEFFSEVFAFYRERTTWSGEILGDLIHFQRNVWIDSGYQKAKGRQFFTWINWNLDQELLNRALTQVEVGIVHRHHVTQKHIGIHRDVSIPWTGDGTLEDRLTWMQYLVLHFYAKYHLGYFTEIETEKIYKIEQGRNYESQGSYL
jgi:hypothetical protein